VIAHQQHRSVVTQQMAGVGCEIAGLFTTMAGPVGCSTIVDDVARRSAD
jgi:hypothetical protein